MKTDSVGQMVLGKADLINLIMQGRDLESVSGALVDDSVDIEAAAFWLEHVPDFTHWTEPDSQQVFDHVQQSIWHMPEEYKKLDIAEHILQMCNNESELQRAGQELLLYQDHGLFDLLRYLKYLVDVMHDNHVIWGVGRGSSVASYVLYLLGVHRINSLYYELDPAEFLR
jgi:DNA polymerase III alpha subunit